MWGIQVLTFASPFINCETSTSSMLLDCRCTLSTSDNIEDHIWIGLIDGMLSRAWKQPNLHNFLNENKNTGKPSSKFRSWNKKKKKSNITHARQISNKILLHE
jgi:hypothetical protein